MTNSKQSHITPEEKPNAGLLLRRFKLMDEAVEKVRQDNIKAGLDPKYMDQLIIWQQDTGERVRYDKWLERVTNKKTGKFNQIKDLRARELIPQEEESEYENNTYPYYTLNSLMKIKAQDGKLWLMRFMRWFGLDSSGNEVSVPVNDLDYYMKPVVSYERVPKDFRDPDRGTIRVGGIKTHLVHSVEQPGPKVYLTPYSKEKVDEFLKYADTTANNGNGPSLLLIKEGQPNPVAATYEQFTDEDFDVTFEKIRRPAPEFKDWYNEYKKQRDAAEDANRHYG